MSNMLIISSVAAMGDEPGKGYLPPGWAITAGLGVPFRRDLDNANVIQTS